MMHSLVLFLIVMVTPPEKETSLSRFPLEETDKENYIGVAVDLYARGNQLFQLENRQHRLLKVEMGETLGEIIVLAERGDGPGDLFAPYRVAGIEGGGIVVVDVRGISIFDNQGDFIRRLRKYTPTLSVAITNDSVFHAMVNVRDPFLIEVFSWEGDKKAVFLERWIDVESSSGSVRKTTSHMEYMHAGFLLTDTRHLYFLNTTFLRFLKMDLQGNILIDKAMKTKFGPKGTVNVRENQKFLDNPALMEESAGHFVYFLFQDAYLHSGRIYLLRTDEPDLDMASEEKEIFVIDAENFELLERYTFRVAKGERVHAMCVTDQQGQPRIIVNMETNDDADVRIIALKP